MTVPRTVQVQLSLKSSAFLRTLRGMNDATLPIGPFARRAGVAASALRFYETQGLVHSTRSSGGQRQFARSDLRRVAFIRAAQAVGLSLADIQAALASLPGQRTPTARDWQRLSAAWRPLLDARINALMQLRDQLTSCIGCGCLSLTKCALYNPGDLAAGRGSGARYLLGDRSADLIAETPAAAATRAARPNPRRTGPGRT
jgi:MerR family redox-sensitive transcriptional activator SoxR